VNLRIGHDWLGIDFEIEADDGDDR